MQHWYSLTRSRGARSLDGLRDWRHDLFGHCDSEPEEFAVNSRCATKASPLPRSESAYESEGRLASFSTARWSRGRKIWLYIGSQRAGPRIAAILSVLEGCRRLKLRVRDYLAAVLPGFGDLSIRYLPRMGPATSDVDRNARNSVHRQVSGVWSSNSAFTSGSMRGGRLKPLPAQRMVGIGFRVHRQPVAVESLPKGDGGTTGLERPLANSV
jgi:hypothetical protein